MNPKIDPVDNLLIPSFTLMDRAFTLISKELRGSVGKFWDKQTYN